MAKTVKIGTWHETERKITGHTSYAADYINHLSKPGDYDAVISFSGGYNIPIPQWLLVKLDTEITDGKYYSGFGGVNFASTDVKTGPATYTLQMYGYEVPKLVDAGKLTLDSEWEFLNDEYGKVLDYIKTNGLPE